MRRLCSRREATVARRPSLCRARDAVALENVRRNGPDPRPRSRHPHDQEGAPAPRKDSDSACEEFATLARSLVKPGFPGLGEGSDCFSSGQPFKVFQKLTKPVSFTTTPAAAGGSGSAAGLGGISPWHQQFFQRHRLRRQQRAEPQPLNQMKEHAGLIGRTALKPILQAIAKKHPALRLHLVGPSDGPFHRVVDQKAIRGPLLITHTSR
jgi:hypothetical protein